MIDIDVPVQEVHGMLRGSAYNIAEEQDITNSIMDSYALNNNRNLFDSTECTYESGSKSFLINYLGWSSFTVLVTGVISGVILSCDKLEITSLPIIIPQPTNLEIIIDAVVSNNNIIIDSILNNKDVIRALGSLEQSKTITTVITHMSTPAINRLPNLISNDLIKTVDNIIMELGTSGIVRKIYPAETISKTEWKYSCYSIAVQLLSTVSIGVAAGISLTRYKEDCIDTGLI